MTDQQAKQWSMFTHLAGLASLLTAGVPLASILAPLILWLMRKDQSEMVDKTGREVLNFQISVMIYFIGAVILCFVMIGFVIAPAIVLLQLIASIVGAVRASNGEDFKYPLSMRFL